MNMMYIISFGRLFTLRNIFKILLFISHEKLEMKIDFIGSELRYNSYGKIRYFRVLYRIER